MYVRTYVCMYVCMFFHICLGEGLETERENREKERVEIWRGMEIGREVGR